MQIFIYCAILVFFYRERYAFQIQPLIFVIAICWIPPPLWILVSNNTAEPHLEGRRWPPGEARRQRAGGQRGDSKHRSGSETGFLYLRTAGELTLSQLRWFYLMQCFLLYLIIIPTGVCPPGLNFNCMF